MSGHGVLKNFALDSSPVRLVCPACRGLLRECAENVVCSKCGADYPWRDGFPDLIHGDRYDDDTPCCALHNEETTNRDTAERYWIPLFRRMLPDAGRARVLSLGCGVGSDVETLRKAGFNAMGIDNGKRSEFWRERRESPESLVMGNGKRMPFEDSTFDVIFCGCVFPHVGVVGTTFDTTSDFYEQRLELAGEMARVLKPGGKIVSCNPNRFFPFDIFHGHKAGKPILRPTMPWKRLLLSRGDYLGMFNRYGCVRATALPVENYWNFTNSKKSFKGRVMAAPVAFLFRLVSRVGFLRGSALNPWLIVMIEKGAAA